MKVVWLCNVIIQDIAEVIGVEHPNSGGWIKGMYNQIKEHPDIDLVILFPHECSVSGRVGKHKYYGFPRDNHKTLFREILAMELPEIVHIYGTEFEHSLSMVDIAKDINIIGNVVVYIQGLVSYISKHYYSHLPSSVIYGFTIRDLLKLDNVYFQRKKFYDRGKIEQEVLSKVHNVIGRTDWDKACANQINSQLNYFECNEILNEKYYTGKWQIERCEEYSLFISQGYYPIKGLHILIEAIVEVVKSFPKCKLYVAGFRNDDARLIDKLKTSYYQKYINNLIQANNLKDKVIFLGSLNKDDMYERYLKSHIYISSSTIENSPNSVGEAMLLGMPVICSDVGGIKNMVRHNSSGYIYQSDAPYMLAYYIKKVFSSRTIARSLGTEASLIAANTHNKEYNANSLLTAYQRIITNEDTHS
ncbi:glycosyltransferase [Vibrio breoganii]